MDIFSLINLILTGAAMAGYAGIRIFGGKPQTVAAIKPSKSVNTSHRLVKTYLATNDDWVDGWRFLCSCGAKGTASNTKPATYSVRGSYGSEASAVEKFKAHRDNFLDANGGDEQDHEDTVALRKLEAEFAEWRKACYCMDTNDDLILLKHRHLDSKQITKVK